MAVIIPPGFIQVTYRWLVGGDPEIQTSAMGFRIDTPPFTQADATALWVAWSDAMLPRLSSGSSLRGLEVLVGSDGDYPEFEVIAALLGTDGANTTPTNTAILVDKKTGVAGRRNRGRMFLWQPQEGQVDNNGYLQALVQSGIQTRVQQWIDQSYLNANVDRWVLLHHSGSATPTIPPVTVYPQVAAQVATQRRRMRR